MNKLETVPTLGMCVDDKYTWPLVIALYSAKINSSCNFKVELANINGGISNENQELLLAFADYFKINLKITNHILDVDVQHDNRISQASFGRFFLLDTLVEPFVYADADVIFEAGWCEIFDWINGLTTERDWVLAARIESGLAQRMINEPGNEARIAAGERYFHAGLMACNPTAWQNSGFASKWRDVAKRHDSLKFRWHDQDVLNYLIAGKIVELPDGFDRAFGESRFAPSSILSCDGNVKPWRVIESEIQKLPFLLLSSSHKYSIGWLNDAILYWEYEGKLKADLGSRKFNEIVKLLKHRSENEISVLNKQLNIKHFLVGLIMKDFSKLRRLG